MDCIFSVELGYTVMPSRLNHYFYKVCHDFVKAKADLETQKKQILRFAFGCISYEEKSYSSSS